MTGSTFAPRFDVRVSGVTLAADLADHVISLSVETDLDLAGSFELVLHDAGNQLLDSALLDLGTTVEIHLGYGNDLVPAFLGEIAAIEPSFPSDGAPTVRVSGYDKSYRMRRTQPEPTEYAFMNDSLIAARLAVENGLVPMVDPTPGLAKRTLRVESDMAFLKARAERYSFDVYVEWDRLHFQLPRPATTAHVLTWGRNLSSFSPRISANGLAGLQVVRGYNQELAQTIYATALAADFDLDDLVERVGRSALDLLQSLVRKGVRREPVANPLDAALLAKSLLANLLEGLYEGSGTCIGTPELSAGDHIAVAGIGRRFSGTYRARKITHRIDASGFTTSFSISQRGHSSLLGQLRKQVAEDPPPDRPEHFSGVLVGEVEANNELEDPPEAALGRVRVSFPSMPGISSTWAACARPMAGDGYGFYAVPERGEQVLVAFQHGNLDEPFVLGSLWSLEQPPPVTNADGTNSTRVIRSRAGHTITFDDTADTGLLTISDKGGSEIVLDARDGSVTVSAKGDLTLQAVGDLTLSAHGGARRVRMTASDVDVS